MRPFVILSCALATAIAPAHAQNFIQAIALARNAEPGYLGAKANLAATLEKANQAYADLLPQLSASVATHDTHRNYLTRDDPFPPSVDRYNNNTAQINLTQPLWRHSTLIAKTQADLAASQAEFQLMTSEQELLARLVGAWVDCMLARDVSLFAERQVAATREQWEVMKRGAQLGIATIPAREETHAKYEQALSDQVSAQMDSQARAAALEQLIGPLTSFDPPFLASPFQGPDLAQDSLERWLESADRTSPSIHAASRALDAASEEIRKQSAGHEPTLDLVGSYNHNGQSVGNFPGQNGYDIRQGAVGLQLNIPIYSGGGQAAKVREAAAMREKARQDLEAARRAVRLAIKQAWFGWQTGRARQRTAEHAIDAATLARDSASVGKSSGLNIDLDLLQAEQQLAGARRDLNKARYEMIAAIFKLKATAGVLSDADIALLASNFAGQEPAAP